MATRSDSRGLAILTAGLIAVAAPQAPVPAHATSYIPAERDISEDEVLQRSISDADVVCIGRILSIRDTITSSGYPYSELLLEPKRVLKGRVGAQVVKVAFILAGMGESVHGQVARRLARTGPFEALAFLTEYQGSLLIDTSPVEFAQGLLEVTPATRMAVESRVMRQVRAQSVDSLVARADMAILGTWQGGFSPCSNGGRPGRCKDIVVDSVITGHVVEDTAQVALAYAQDIPLGQSLFFLERRQDGVHELVQFKAGVHPVKDGRVRRPDGTLGAFMRTIRETAARVGRSREGR